MTRSEPQTQSEPRGVATTDRNHRKITHTHSQTDSDTCRFIGQTFGRFYDLDDIPRWQHANLPWDSITKDLAARTERGNTLDDE